jgi:hypothetical protein
MYRNVLYFDSLKNTVYNNPGSTAVYYTAVYTMIILLLCTVYTTKFAVLFAQITIC